MFSNLSGLGRLYKKLPPHQNVRELTDNMEVLANYFLDRGSSGALSGRDVGWEWKLGEDMKTLIEYVRAYIPDDAFTKTPR
ncbi:hypothetical protein [Microvirga lenta]|uniref:hypothetical protein n=1 Tax=Microvirga lenta TaxID=2881337 RepID=UPI001CFF6169|nr:hypothetical protein [Microvirga lenta]MCB5175538.1 hypothetical protein [Microvirga lenta]